MSASPADTGQPLSPEQQRRGQHYLIRLSMVFGCTSALVWSVCPLFMLSLGATPFHLGLLETAMRLAMTVRLLSARLILRVGKARLMFLGRVGMWLPVAGLVALAFNGDDGGASIWLAVGTIFLLAVFNHVGNTAWWPLIQDNTPRAGLGGFLSRMRIRQRSLDLVLPLVIGWHLGTHPSSQRFAVLFALGLAFNILAAFVIRKISESTVVASDSGYWRGLVDTARVPALRRYGLFALAYGFVTAAILPFWVVLLTGAGMGAVYFVWMTSVGALGYIVALHGWGRLIDNHGSRPAFAIALVCKGALGLMWLALPSEPLMLILWATALYFFWGVLESGASIAQNRAMMDAVPGKHQAEGFALAVYASAIGGAGGGLAGGFALQWFTPTADSTSDPRILYLAGVQMALIAVWYLSTLLVGHREQASVRSLVRPLLRSDRNKK